MRLIFSPCLKPFYIVHNLWFFSQGDFAPFLFAVCHFSTPYTRDLLTVTHLTIQCQVTLFISPLVSLPCFSQQLNNLHRIQEKCFSGEDTSYFGSFLESCENAFRNSSIAIDEDKIAFLRSHHVIDSLTSCMMRATYFSHQHLQYDYPKFRSSLL